jgi:hypothetical protein
MYILKTQIKRTSHKKDEKYQVICLVTKPFIYERLFEKSCVYPFIHNSGSDEILKSAYTT